MVRKEGDGADPAAAATGESSATESRDGVRPTANRARTFDRTGVGRTARHGSSGNSRQLLRAGRGFTARNPDRHAAARSLRARDFAPAVHGGRDRGVAGAAARAGGCRGGDGRARGDRDRLMTINTFVSQLEQLGVRVSVREGRLRVSAPPGVLTSELQAQIASRKEELKALFQEPAAAKPPIRAVSRGDTAPVSFGQQRLWFLHQFDPTSPAYNLGQSIRFRGRLDIAALERSVEAIVERHEVLRTTYRVESGLPVQVVAPPSAVRLAVEQAMGVTDAEREADLQRQLRKAILAPFDLAKGPLFETRVWRLGDDHHVLLFRMHHIASDGWSIGILFHELSSLYVGFVSGKPASLPPLSVQYADFAVWQREWLSEAVLARELGYWRQQLAGVPVLELPTD